MGLTFGNTWQVIAVAIAGVLIMAFLLLASLILTTALTAAACETNCHDGRRPRTKAERLPSSSIRDAPPCCAYGTELAGAGLFTASLLETQQYTLPLWFLTAMVLALGRPEPRWVPVFGELGGDRSSGQVPPRS